MWISQLVAARKSPEHARTTPHFMYMSNVLCFGTFILLYFMLKRGLDKPINAALRAVSVFQQYTAFFL